MNGRALALLACLAACGGAPSYEACAVRCGSGDACPPGQACLADTYCHARADEPLCPTMRDAGPTDAPGADTDPARDDATPAACVSDAGDPACNTCIKRLCCGDLEPCLDDLSCTCYIQCYLQTHDVTMCVTPCGPPNSLAAALDGCRANNCPSDCQ